MGEGAPPSPASDEAPRGSGAATVVVLALVIVVSGGVNLFWRHWHHSSVSCSAASARAVDCSVEVTALHVDPIRVCFRARVHCSAKSNGGAGGTSGGAQTRVLPERCVDATPTGPLETARSTVVRLAAPAGCALRPGASVSLAAQTSAAGSASSRGGSGSGSAGGNGSASASGSGR